MKENKNRGVMRRIASFNHSNLRSIASIDAICMGIKMEAENRKCVMVIDDSLPLGLISNTAAVMGVTLGKQVPDMVGEDVYDHAGNTHLGIVEMPIPILRGSIPIIKELRNRLYDQEFEEITTVDFSDVAQRCKTYTEFIEKIGHVSEEDLRYLGIAIYGNKKMVNKLTGSMPLLR